MKVSVIIPAYNEEKDIKNCLDSLDKQVFNDFEVIVVDDGSKDRTFEVAKNFKPGKFTLKVYSIMHQGAGSSRNFVVGKSKGEILVFIDADMTFEKDFIGNLIKPIIKGKEVGTFSKEEFLANKDNVWAICWNLNRGLPKNRMHKKGYPKRQKVFRAILRKEFLKAGGFDVRAGYSDDWSLSERLGVLAVNAPEAVFYHKNPGSLKEVFIQSKWMGKRRYKFGPFGVLIALLRVSLPFSLFFGIVKGFVFAAPLFPVFKIVSDFAVFVGILQFVFLKDVKK